MIKPSLQEIIELACLAEVIAPKPGNVHPGHAFHDTTWRDFASSAEIIAPILSATKAGAIGTAVLDAVTAVQSRVSRNTNLGIILLLAPLCAVPAEKRVKHDITEILKQIDLTQTEQVFRAIALANPGGLGEASAEDVHAAPSLPLVEVMALARDRDLIARQYATNYADVLLWAECLREFDFSPAQWQNSIIELQLRILIDYPDSLILRKCGRESAQQASFFALRINMNGGTSTPEGRALLQEFSAWLSADGNRRNPGTTADLIAATLFVAQRDYGVKLPTKAELLEHAERVTAMTQINP
jgi:triphosphoribosyl-dephospho-CoA synthase